MPRRNFRRFLKAALIPLFVVATALPMAVAQTLTGSLSGTVVDSSDAVLPGATVTLVNDLSGDQRTTVTNEAGNFVFAAVQAGTYTVKVELSGFQAIETKGIVLRLGEKRNLTGIKLGVAGLSEQVAVTAVTELAPVSSGEKSVSISGEQIQNTAIVGRSAAELLKILPGMAPSNGSSSGAHRASTARSTASTATAKAVSRAPSATTRRTAPTTIRSTSSSTAPMAPTRAATARPR